MEILENKDNLKIYIEETEHYKIKYTVQKIVKLQKWMLMKIEIYFKSNLIYKIKGYPRGHNHLSLGPAYRTITIEKDSDTRIIKLNSDNELISDRIISEKEEYYFNNRKFLSLDGTEYTDNLASNNILSFFYDKCEYFNCFVKNDQKRGLSSRILKLKTKN